MAAMLAGRTALITGASSGIGMAVARKFAAEGAKLVLAARRADRQETLAAELRGLGADVLVRATDVTREERVTGLFADAEAFGAVDVIVNNAGMAVHKPTLEVTLEDWRRVVDLNLTASITHPGITRSELAADARTIEPGPTTMSGESVANAVTPMAAMPFETNLLTAAMLPIMQPYLGRG